MPVADHPLPVTDTRLSEPALDLDALERHWAAYGARRAMNAEQMRGADRRAQRMGVSGRELMEQAGTAVAAAVRALSSGRYMSSTVAAGRAKTPGDTARMV